MASNILGSIAEGLSLADAIREREQEQARIRAQQEFANERALAAEQLNQERNQLYADQFAYQQQQDAITQARYEAGLQGFATAFGALGSAFQGAEKPSDIDTFSEFFPAMAQNIGDDPYAMKAALGALSGLGLPFSEESGADSLLGAQKAYQLGVLGEVLPDDLAPYSAAHAAGLEDRSSATSQKELELMSLQAEIDYYNTRNRYYGRPRTSTPPKDTTPDPILLPPPPGEEDGGEAEIDAAIEKAKKELEEIKQEFGEG